MASSLTLKIGSLTSTISFNKTDAEVAAILRRFIQDRASPPPPDATAQEKNQLALDEAASEIKRMIVQEATRVGLREKRAAQASIELEADNENAL